MTNLGSMLKSRDIALLTHNQIYAFSSSYGCEIWTITKAECYSIDALNCRVGEDS